MQSVHPGRLRPWVRLRTPLGVVEARPNSLGHLSHWADILWDFCLSGQQQAWRSRVTAIRRLPEPVWSCLAVREFRLSKAELLELGSSNPHAACLVWGQQRPCSTNPWPTWKRWAALARRAIWPLGLLYHMALEDCRGELLEPGYASENWLSELALCAGNWLGPEVGAAVWNSLVVGGSPAIQKLRWKLSFLSGISVEPCLREEELDRLLAVLPDCRPEHRPHWRLVLDSPVDSRDLACVWKQPLSCEELHQVTLDPDEAVQEVVEQCPDRLSEFIRLQLSCPGLEEHRLVALFSDCADWQVRVLLLACLYELEQARAPSPELLKLAACLEGGQKVLEAAERWSGSEVRPSLSVPGLAPELLARLESWRKLSGQAHPWPKSLRRWLKRDCNWRCQDAELRGLLKLQQNFQKLLAEQGTLAWRALLRPLCRQLLSQFCGETVPEQHLELGWLVVCPDLTGELLAALFQRESPRNQRWLSRQSVNLEIWLQGWDRTVSFEGVEYRMHTADRWQTMQMGSDFGTCLTLRNGIYRGSALINSLDVNKHVLYLRRPDGQPILRQMLAITEQGGLQRYPLYERQVSPGLRQRWSELVEQFATCCGLPGAQLSEKVKQIHPYSNYYCDYPEERPVLEGDESDFLSHPNRLDCASHWASARHLGAVLAGRPARACCISQIAEELGNLGQTSWLPGWRRRRLPTDYLKNLDYRADCRPLVTYFRLGPRSPRGATLPPAALVSLEFADLCTVLRGLGSVQTLPALCLLLISWKRRPDPKAFWRHLRGGLQILSLLSAVIPEFPAHLRLAQPEHRNLLLDPLDRILLDLLWKGELRDWVFRGSQQHWALQVLARMHIQGDLHIPREVLLDWCEVARCGGWLWRDLGGCWRELSVMEVAVGLIRCPQATWNYIESLGVAPRIELTIALLWLVDPATWERLSAWVPADPPESFRQDQGRRSFRLQAWCEQVWPALPPGNRLE
ncbi:hypothetical protein JST97_35490 [bacterium]|nr:hypothetical protein [bacterium]